MHGDTDPLDDYPRQCGMCDQWERDHHALNRGRCPMQEDLALVLLSSHSDIPDPKGIHVYRAHDADATLCRDFEWSQEALSEATAISLYHATTAESRRTR